MIKIYLAGPLFSIAEREFNERLFDELTKIGYSCWLPQSFEIRDGTTHDIFQKDVDGIDWCDIILANMDGPDPDSGTCWEIGYAYKSDKTIICYRTDFRSAADTVDAPYNLMMSESAHFNIVFEFGTTFKQMIDKISDVISTNFI